MVNQSSTVVRKALAETALWCSIQSLSSESPETEDTLRRRRVIQEAGKLLQRAPLRDAYKSREWQQAIDAIKEADPGSLAPLEDQLRSPELEPPFALGNISPEAMREEIVAELIVRRSQLLSSHHATEIAERFLNQPGRLLIYVPSENVADGASRYASKGFYDLYDTPPWDCWVHYSDRELTSWVPAVLIPLAQEGIDANPVECLRWLT